MSFGALRECSMADFPLRWRWMSGGQSQFPNDTLRVIRPLERSEAMRIWQEYARYFRKDGALVPALFSRTELVDATDPLSVERLFASLSEENDSRLLLSWEPETAVIIPLELFRLRWADFCYPASDDIAIIPESRKWVLAFWHWEQFELGRSPAA